MADFDIQDPNVFSEKLRKFETTDKAHADLFNAVVEVLINNDAFLKAVADDYSKRHKTDETIHISAKEREDWNEKAEKSTATQTENGLLSAEDKEKLDGIAAGANKYTHPATDGNKHVPATGTTNDGKILMAGSTSGNFAWKHPTFTQAASRANLTPGEKLMISLGKIMKWFADLKAHAFAFPVNNLLGTDANLALSAPMGKELDRKIAELNNKLKNTIQTEDQKVGMTSDGEGGNFWFMSPKGVRWEVDAVNETVRFFNYLTMAGFTIDQSGNMSVSGDIAVGSLNITLSKMLETLNTQTYCICFLEKNTNEFSNFLRIDLTNKFSAVNLRLSIYHPPGHVVTNSPIPNDTEYLVYREVFYHNSNAVLVKLTQAYPETGKTWVNFYNGKTWSGWKVI